jgi:excinuclease ABC subunit C
MVDLTTIPTNPGCYLYKNKQKKVIYVGKAKNLKKRVSSYFSKTHEDTKTKKLVEQIEHTEFIITNTEYEALILENNLIKKYRPRYNIDLKDSRRYAYIKVTKEEYPRLLVARTREGEGDYYGPFVSGINREYVLEGLQKTFKIRTCNKLPKKACIRHAMGLCSAPCIQKISKKEYEEDITAATLVLKGKTKRVIKILETKMRVFSQEKNFELAMQKRDQIYALKKLGEKQTVERQKQFDEDIINFSIHEGRVYLLLFNTKKGILDNKQDFEFSHTERFLEQFITQYYGEEPTLIPKEIILPTKVPTYIQQYLTQLKGKKVIITTPKKGEKKELLTLVKKNIELTLHGETKKLEELQKKLSLGNLPKVIECFDISHLTGTSTVASMVQFRNGKPDKNNYRKYKIRTVKGIDDYASMKEVVSRRYTRLKKEQQPMPDLIIIDGGKGQLNAVIQMMEAMFLKIPVVSIAKREEEIFIPGKETSIKLGKKSGALQLVQQLRNEAHRTAITYNRLLRRKKIRE